MNAKQVFFASVLAATLVVGCKRATLPRARIKNVSPQLNIVSALDMGLNEIRRQGHDLSKPYELTANVSGNGEWVFTIYFLPAKPEAEIITYVGTNGVRVTRGL